jgi:16S rRNA processing protein RimM
VTPQSSRQAETFILLGTITKPHGIQGELKVRPYTETPGNISQYRRLFLSADKGKSRAPYTNILTRVSGNAVILRLEECSTRNQAEQLSGMQIWLPSSDLLPIGEDEFYLYTLEGKQAKTVAGLILGKIKAIVCTSGQDILVIQDAQKEYLVPLVRQFIVAIDEEMVVFDLPPGLLEINS